MRSDAVLVPACARPSCSRIRAAAFLPGLVLAASRALGMLAQVGAQLAVGMLSGPAGLGLLQLLTAWSTLLGELLARGWPTASLKQVAIAWSAGDRAQCARLVIRARRAMFGRRWVRRWVFGASLLAIPVASGLGPAGAHVLLIASLPLAAVSFSLLRLMADALKALDGPIDAVTFESLVPPLVLLLACFCCWWFDAALTPLRLALGFLAGLAVGVVALGLCVRRKLQSREGHAAQLEPCVERNERRAMWLNAVLAIAFIQFPFFVLPLFADLSTIGVFSVAHKLMNVITTLLLLLASVYGPAFARAAARDDRAALRALLWRTQVISLAVFLPSAAVLIVAHAPIADLFRVPADLLGMFLILLVAGQAINAATGLAGVLLSMTGAARKEWRIALGAFGLLLLGTLPVGIVFGAEGIAVLFSVVVALKNLGSWLVARTHLKQGEVIS